MKTANYEDIVINGDLENLCNLMDNYGDSDSSFVGEDNEGETVIISIFSDYIVTETLQDNGWTRLNYFYRDGTIEEIYKKPEE